MTLKCKYSTRASCKKTQQSTTVIVAIEGVTLRSWGGGPLFYKRTLQTLATLHLCIGWIRFKEWALELSNCPYYVGHNLFNHSAYRIHVDVKTGMVNGIEIAGWCFSTSFAWDMLSKCYLHQNVPLLAWRRSIVEAENANRTQTSSLPAQSNEWENRISRIETYISRS
jgi:hypothetical protein